MKEHLVHYKVLQSWHTLVAAYESQATCLEVS